MGLNLMLCDGANGLMAVRG